VPFTVDDRFHSHAKVLALTLDARGLWVSAGSWSADHGTHGVVPDHVIASLGGTPEVTGKLVRAGMWGRADDAIEFHDWDFWNSPPALPAEPVTLPTSAPASVPRSARRSQAPGARRTALCRAPGLKRRLRDRDRDLCRYCGAAVRWGAGRAADSGTWDWIDPLGEATEENIVTACKACGEDRSGGSLEDAGMTLLPPPPRNASCNASAGEDCNASGSAPRNASELGNDNSGDQGNASCNGYTDSRNAYIDGTPGQKRYTPAKNDDPNHSDLDQSSIRVSHSPAPLKLDARARKAKPGSQEFRLHVIAKFAAKTNLEITAAQADAIAAEVLPRAKGKTLVSQLAYVLRAIRNEAKPIGRWLPELAPLAAEEAAPAPALKPEKPAGRDWCGECYRPDDRNVYDDQGRPKPCPRCGPMPKPAWEAA
jgi:hypothetical protein